MNTINWGIIGASRFAREHMGPAIHAAEGARLCALASSDPAKAAGFQAFCPDLQLVQGYEALLADPGIDSIYIPLPNHLHVEASLQAAAAGKHVLCEKPMGLTVGDYDRLIAARDGAALQMAEAFMILHHPQWHQVRDWIRAGEIGEIIHADAAFSFRLEDSGNIRMRPETAGGSLRDIGVYTFGALRYATGAEVDPAGLVARLGLENGVDTFAHVFGEMAGPGRRFTFASTTSMRAAKRQTVVIQGTKGLIRVDGGAFNANVHDLARVELQQGSRTISERYPAVNQYRLQVEAFGRAIRGEADYPVPLEFSRGTQAALDAVFRIAG